MKEPSVFYRALDPQKGSWDGYGFFLQNGADFMAYVADAPSGASIQTPELIRAFWTENLRDHPFSGDPTLGCVELADSINRLQDFLRRKSRSDAALYQSTLCIVRKSGNRLFYASIGDSCIFLLRNGALYRLDSAETWNGALIARPQDDLRERQKTGAITFAGVDGAFLDPGSVRVLELHPNERVVLATDGVSDVLSPTALVKLIQASPESIRVELDRMFAADRIQDDVTLMILDPEVIPERDVTAELQALHTQIDKLQADNARLHRELDRTTALQSRIERLEKRTTTSVGRTAVPAEDSKFSSHDGGQGRTSHKQAERAPYKFSAQKASRKWPDFNLWIWIGAAFAGGLILGLSIFLWSSQSAAAPTEKAEAPIATPERRPVITPPAFSRPVECFHVVQQGDSLGKIALGRNLSMENLLKLNPGLKANSALKIGQRLQVCAGDQP